MRNMGMSPLMVEYDPDQEFKVVVDRSEQESPPVGADLEAGDGRRLKVLRLKEGLLRKYNRTCRPPDQPVQAGDYIVQVNSIRGSSSMMLRELEYNKRFELTLHHGSAPK